MKKHIMRRALSIVLTVMLLVGIVPGAAMEAFAADVNEAMPQVTEKVGETAEKAGQAAKNSASSLGKSAKGVYYSAVNGAKSLYNSAANAVQTALMTGTYGDYQYTILDDGTAEITKYKGSEEEIVIPGEVDGHKVTGIGNSAFYSCDNLLSVTIPEGVTSIGNYAFYDCYWLTNAVIPDSVITIGNYAFSCCYDLVNVAIPNSVLSIGNNAFSSCRDLESISIPKNLSEIGENAFSDCSSLQTITVDPENEYFSSYENVLFNKDKTLLIQYPTGSTVRSYTVPDGVVTIGEDSFKYCKLYEINFSDSVTTIEGEAFYDCYYLEDINFSDSVTTIGFSAFYACNNITDIELPNSVITIGASAFRNCSDLTDIKISDSVTEIGNEAFKYCSNLSDVTFGNGLKKIGTDAFSETAVTDIVIPKNVSEMARAFSGASYLKNVTFEEGTEIIPFLSFYECTGVEKILIPNSVTIINTAAFEGCTGLTSISIPNSVTDIGGSAFAGCTGLTSILIPDSVVAVGGYAFGGCTNLADIKLGSGITELGASVFEGTAITEIFIPKSFATVEVSYYTESPFAGASNLKKVVFEDGISAIPEYTFNNCQAIEEIVFPKSITSIGKYAFSGYTGLTEFPFLPNLTVIGEGAFSGCTGITEAVTPESLTEIGDNAFSGCLNLASINLNDKLEKIGILAFSDTGIVEMDIPKSVTTMTKKPYSETCSALEGMPNLKKVIFRTPTIPGSVLADCPSVEVVIMTDDVTTVGSHAFENCTGLKKIRLSNNLKRLEGWTFAGCTSLSQKLLIPYTEYLGGFDFAGCTSLKEVYLYTTYNWLAYTFQNCTNLEKLAIDGNYKMQLTDTFKGCDSTKLTVYSPITNVWVGARTEGMNSHSTFEGFDFTPDPDSYDIEEEIRTSYLGIIDSNTENTIKFNGKTYDRYIPEWNGGSKGYTANLYKGKTALVKLNKDEKVLSISTPKTEQGIFMEWDPDDRYARIGDMYYFYDEFLTDESVLALIPKVLDKNVEVSYFEQDGKKYIHKIEACSYTTGKITAFDPLSSPAKVYIDGVGYDVADNDDIYGKLQNLQFQNVIITVTNGCVTDAIPVSEAVSKPTVSLELTDYRLDYQKGKYNKDKIGARVVVTNNVKGRYKADLDMLKGISELDLTVSEIKVTVERNKTFYFGLWHTENTPDNEFIVKLKEPVVLRAGETHTFTPDDIDAIKVNGKYVPQGTDTLEYVTADYTLSRNGKEIKGSNTQKVSVTNMDKQSEVGKDNSAEMRKQREIIKKAAEDVAGQLKENSTSTLDPQLGRLFTKEQIEAIKAAWVYDLAINYMNTGTASEDYPLLDKYLDDLKPDITFGKVHSSIKMTIPTRTCGELEFEFTFTGVHVGFDEEPPIGLECSVEYKIVGGNKEAARRYLSGTTSGFAGGVAMKNFRAFVDSVTALVKEEFKTEVWEEAQKNAIKAKLEFTLGRSLDDVEIALLKIPALSDVYVRTLNSAIKKYSFACPVDVYVYNDKNELCGAIVGNEVTKEHEDLILEVQGEKKIVTVLNGSYRFECVATGAGTMDIEIIEYLNSEQVRRSIEFTDVPLKPGKTYATLFPEGILQDEEEFKLISDDNEVIDCSGSKDLYEDYDIADFEAELSETEYVYDGTAKEPEVFIAGLVNGIDYYVEYADNVEAGTAKLTIIGCGAYHGRKTVEFTITSSVLLGDVNSDGFVDAADAILIKRYDAGLTELTEEQLRAADVTGDGFVDAADAVKILRYDSGLIADI